MERQFKYSRIANNILLIVTIVMLFIEPIVSVLIITTWLLIYYITNRLSFELKVKHIIKHIWMWMQRFDGLWAPLVGILMFFGASYFAVNILGLSTVGGDPGVVVSFFLSQALTIMIFTGAIYGLRFQASDIYDYLYKSFTKEALDSGDVVSSKSDFKIIEPWQRLKFLFAFLLLYVAVSMINFLILA